MAHQTPHLTANPARTVETPGTRATRGNCMDHQKTAMIALSIGMWVGAAALMVTVLYAQKQLRPEVWRAVRRTFNLLAKAWWGVAVLIQLAMLVLAFRGIILPGWSYVVLIFGLLAPLQIALAVAGDLFGIQRASEMSAEQR